MSSTNHPGVTVRIETASTGGSARSSSSKVVPPATVEVAEPPPPVVPAGPCTPTHLDNSFWDDGDEYYTWDGGLGQWIPNGPQPIQELQPIGTWALNDYRPTQMNITISVPDVDPSSFPVETGIMIGLVGGAFFFDSVDFEDASDVKTLQIPMDWSAIPLGSPIINVRALSNKTIEGPRITCLQFVD